jgi:putative addiction module component (TIGR02574 family)
MSRQLMPEILKMSADERIALADAIYESVDDIAVNRVAARERREDQTMLSGQQAELERRIAYYEAHPELLVPAENVLAKLKRAR